LPESYVYYVIRHKATGELMPEVKRKGYSHWNPSTGSYPTYALGTPRLLDTRRKAAGCINQWACNPNARASYKQGYFGEEDYEIDIKPDGRSKDDLEIVEVELKIP
jgi:hypothetical protein